VDEYRHYSCLSHGVGQCDEWPDIKFPEAWEAGGYDGVLEPGMVMTVESYVGAYAGGEGVKLENQVLITQDGPENLSPWSLDLDSFHVL
jgi:Xaa-Pro aminopeptidase